MRDDRQRTRQLLIAAARRLFAERGFKHVTVRDICREAHANVAAVNYHFRHKLGLYKAVMDDAVALMRSATDAAIQAGASAEPEQQLRAYIRVVCEQVFAAGPDPWVHQLIHREMASPTPMLKSLVDRGIRPRLDYLARVVGGLLERPSDDPLVLQCVGMIHGQIVMSRPNPISDRLRGHTHLTSSTVDQISRRIAEFSLGGIRRLAG